MSAVAPLAVVSPFSPEGAWIWVGAILTISIFSFLWRDNPLYRFAEHLFVGVSIGYVLVLIWNTSTYPDLVLPLFFGREKSTYDTSISVSSGNVLRFTQENWDVDQTVTLHASGDRDPSARNALIRLRMPSGANRIAAVEVEAVRIDAEASPGLPADGEDGSMRDATARAATRAADGALRFIVDPVRVEIPRDAAGEFRVRLSEQPPREIKAVVARVDQRPVGGRLLLLIPLALGLMLAARVVPKAAWMSRITLALLVGMGAGAAIPTVLQARVLTQAAHTVSVPLLAIGDAGRISWWETFNNLVLIVGVITSLIYFWFSIEHKGAVGVAAKTGIYFLMVGFGAAFGYTVMARVSLLIGRVLFLLRVWLEIA